VIRNRILSGSVCVAVVLLSGVLVLKPFAQAEQMVYEGDGMSTDISADGQVLVGWDFRNGELVAFDARTHETTFRMRDHGPDEIASWAVVSSDGSRIAYTLLNHEAYYDLRIVDRTPASDARVLFSDALSKDVEAFDWSPDSRRVLVALNYWTKPNELVEISTVDEKRNVIESFDRRTISGACYFHDGSVAYAAQADRTSLQEELYVRDEATRVPVLVASDVSPGSPVFCLDTGVAFVATRQNRRGLFFSPRPASGARPEPRFVFDLAGGGDVLGITRDGTIWAKRPFPLAGPDVFFARLDPNTGRVLGAAAKVNGVEETSAHEPSWGPDGKTITYWSVTKGKPTLVLKRSESAAFPLPFQPQGSLPWFPDGASVAAVSADGPNTSFHRINIATGIETLIHRSNGVGAQRQVALSRDGNRLFYVVRDNAHDRMILNSCSTSHDDCHDVLNRSIPPAWPSWSVSPSGSKLAVIAYDDDHTRASHIQIYDQIPGVPRELYRGQPWVDGSKFGGITWSPDERWLYFVKPLHQSDGDEQLWRISTAGGGPEPIGISMRGFKAPAVDVSGTQLLFEGPTTRLGRERLVSMPSELTRWTQQH